MRFKCIKDTIGFKAGEYYDISGTVLMSNELNDMSIPLYVVRSSTEYFEEAITKFDYYLTSTGSVAIAGAGAIRSYNVFATESEVRMEALRRQSMGERWMPEKYEGFWYFSFEDQKSFFNGSFSDNEDILNYFIGNCHETQEQSTIWAHKYFDAFDFLLKK